MKKAHTHIQILAVVGALVALHCGKSPGKNSGATTSGAAEETGGSDPTDGGSAGGGNGSAEANLVARSKLFKDTVHKTLTDYCSTCHAKGTSPEMAQDDPLKALKEIETDEKIDYVLPESSRLVERLSLNTHNCWNRCEDDAKVMLDSIKEYISKAEAAKIMPAPEKFQDTDAVALSSAVSSPGTQLAGIYVKYATMGSGLVAPMAAKTDDKDGAIETYYSTGTANAGEIVYTLNVLEAGTYAVWLKVKNSPPPANARTLRISVDNGAPVVWTQVVAPATFTWDSLKAAANGPATTFNLQPGSHTIKVLGAAVGVKFNSVALTKTLTNFQGDEVVDMVKTITIPLDKLAPGKNAKLIVEVSELDAKTKTSQIRNIKLVGGPLKIKDLRPVVNGTRRKLWSGYRAVDMTVPAAGPEGVIVSRDAQIIYGEGFATDKLSFTFGEIK